MSLWSQQSERVILFQLMGLALLGIGIYVRTLKDLGSVIKSTVPWFFDPSIYFIIIGAFIFILAFLGCIGALRENICMLKTVRTCICIVWVGMTVVCNNCRLPMEIKVKTCTKEHMVWDPAWYCSYLLGIFCKIRLKLFSRYSENLFQT